MAADYTVFEIYNTGECGEIGTAIDCNDFETFDLDDADDALAQVEVPDSDEVFNGGEIRRINWTSKATGKHFCLFISSYPLKLNNQRKV